MKYDSCIKKAWNALIEEHHPAVGCRHTSVRARLLIFDHFNDAIVALKLLSSRKCVYESSQHCPIAWPRGLSPESDAVLQTTRRGAPKHPSAMTTVLQQEGAWHVLGLRHNKVGY